MKNITQLQQSCHDILVKNMEYTDQTVYLLYDTESPLARILSDAWISVLEKIKNQSMDCFVPRNDGNAGQITIREFKNPPQPLYRGGLINPDNPHLVQQNRIITSHNIDENKRVGLDHHEVYQTQMAPGQKRDPELPDVSVGESLEQILPSHPRVASLHPSDEFTFLEGQKPEEQPVDPQIEILKNELISLPAGSIVILVQSTNFRLSTFRIRLELFHLGIHVVEFNHLAYIQEDEFTTFATSLSYQTDEYVRQEGVIRGLIEANNEAGEKISEYQSSVTSGQLLSQGAIGTTRIQSVNGEFLTFGALEKIRGNTGNYTGTVNKGGTFPLGEVFTESVELDSLNGRCLIESYPREDFSVDHCTPFELVIENGRVLPSPYFPAPFAKLYDWIVQYEGEVMVRELGMGLNTAITTTTPLSDINFYERKIGIHLSLGKKHGIYGKKLPKTMIQRFHIDVFIATEGVYIGDQRVYEGGGWRV